MVCGNEGFEGKTKEVKPTVSKIAVAAFILGVLSVFTFLFSYVVVIVLSAIAFVKIKRSNGELKGKWFAISGLLIPIVIFTPILIIWFQDAGPVPDDITEADLLQIKSENKASYDVLLRLCNDRFGSDDAPAIGLNDEDEELLSALYSEILGENMPAEEVFSRISENRQQINLLWEKAKRARKTIHQLATYDEITDLIDFVKDSPPEILSLVNLNRLYCFYFLSSLEKGGDEIPLNELLECDKVVRNLAIFCRTYVTKMACLLSIRDNLKTASIAINHQNVSDEEFMRIKSHFSPITHQHVSLKNYVLSLYLGSRDLQDEILSSSNKSVLPFLKINSANRFRYSLTKNLILRDEDKQASKYCELSVWPWEYNWPKLYFTGSNVREQFRRGSLYFWYNPVACQYLTFSDYGLFSDETFQKKNEIQITDDLFQWVLARRLGQKNLLKARAYSDEYTVDIEKGLVFSVGPDGEAYTDDDIKLQINPEVLGLK